jgi:hypothetical protein
MTGESTEEAVEPRTPSLDPDTLLIAEIQLCQQALDSLVMRSWQSTGILMAGAMASLVLMVQIDATVSALNKALVTTFFAAGALMLIATWMRFVSREAALQRSTIERMKDLEKQVGFGRQAKLSSTEISRVALRLGGFSLRMPAANQAFVLRFTGRLLMLGWVGIAVWRWLIYFEYLV